MFRIAKTWWGEIGSFLVVFVVLWLVFAGIYCFAFSDSSEDPVSIKVAFRHMITFVPAAAFFITVIWRISMPVGFWYFWKFVTDQDALIRRERNRE